MLGFRSPASLNLFSGSVHLVHEPLIGPTENLVEPHHDPHDALNRSEILRVDHLARVEDRVEVDLLRHGKLPVLPNVGRRKEQLRLVLGVHAADRKED